MSSDVAATTNARSPVRLAGFLLLFALVNGLLVNWALPNLPWQAQQMTTLSYTEAFIDHTAHGDSWKAMRTALFYTDEARVKPIYTALYFENNVRFQYPPSSLLVLRALRAMGGDAAVGDGTLNRIGWWCVVGIAMSLVPIFYLARKRYGLVDGDRGDGEGPGRLLPEALFALATVAMTLTFYPIVRGYYLGQIQVWIDLLIALVVLAWLVDRKSLSGFFLALICVIKPTLALVVIWGALRREWSFIRGFAIPMAGFAALSLYAFGWDNHVDYLGVLSYISQQGEIFNPNQSMNGLLHRLLHNGNSLEWAKDGLITYNPFVHAGTVLSTLALMGAGLFASRSESSEKNAGPLELAIIIVCATLASPTVWTHHYGVMLPLFAVALPAVLSLEQPVRQRYLLGLVVSFALMSNNFRLLNRLAETNFNFLQSYVYFAGLGLLVLLFALRRRKSNSPDPA
ncbi:MAG: alpha-1,2-mannosyltransferase [Myxococcota bacterium]|jgi:alpha-1,2-mannosyltransferase